MKTAAWGIDLGTTNSCIARATATDVTVVHIDEAPTVPSVLAWDGTEFLVGRRAANHAVIAPDQAVRSIKRHMGNADHRVRLGLDDLSPIDVSAKILGYLRTQAQIQTGEVVEEAVITVPAWFNEPQRRATLKAGECAGLKVTRIINEPTAAGLAYTHTAAAVAGAAPTGAAERWLVYDLGGGTFDVSILSVAGNYTEVLASCGNTYLGGDDFDHRIVLHWVDRLRDRHNADVTQDRVAMAQLRHLAEQTKVRLSAQVEVHAHAYIESAGKRAESNSEVRSARQITRLAQDYTVESEADEVAGGEVANPPQLSNFLIEQVERHLAGSSGEWTRIRAALQNYRELLANGRDAEIDDVEEELYAWLDSVRAHGAAAGADSSAGT